MGAALGWGAVAASSLVIGALLGLARPWPDRQVGLVLAFGAGALISAVSFELVQEGANVAGPGWVALGLAAGALTYYFVNEALGRHESTGGAGTALALGAFLDGIPEQAVLGISLAEGGEVSVGLLVAIFVSNLPEAIGSATELRMGGIAPRRIRQLWIGVALICVLAAGGGYAIADVTGGHLQAAVNGFAAGALLVMLVDEMIPSATRKFGQRAGLVTTLGFAVAAGLSGMSA
jgi:ZIP family zinc transporter